MNKLWIGVLAVCLMVGFIGKAEAAPLQIMTDEGVVYVDDDNPLPSKTQTESTPAYTQRSSQNWWTVTRYDMDTKVTAGASATATKVASDGHSWVATGYSIGGVGCGPFSWRLLVNASMVACGTAPCADYSVPPAIFPIPIKAGNNEAIALEVTVEGALDAYVLITLYGRE